MKKLFFAFAFTFTFSAMSFANSSVETLPALDLSEDKIEARSCEDFTSHMMAMVEEAYNCLSADDYNEAWLNFYNNCERGFQMN